VYIFIGVDGFIRLGLGWFWKGAILVMVPEVFSSGFLIFRKQKNLQFLLMKHADRWDLPKGHLDAGETKQQAALRELTEETGITATSLWIDPQFVYENRYWVSYKRNGGVKQLKELTIYLGFLTSAFEVVVTEHQGYSWFDWSPPHSIQSQTIDPLLVQVDEHIQKYAPWPPEITRS
jgi:8-oxo-dGTP pyrophosphatase MutT (NUDIX family)